MTVQHPLKLQEAAFLDESKVCLMRADSQETDLHEHEFLELTYVTRGSAQHQLGAAVMELHAGDYFLVDLGSLHSYRNGQGLEVINCLFSPAYVDRALVHCPSLATLLSTDMRQFGAPVVSPADRVFHDSNGDILRLMEAMEREYAQRAVGYLEMIRCHLIQVLVRTIRSAAVGGLDGPAASGHCGCGGCAAGLLCAALLSGPPQPAAGLYAPVPQPPVPSGNGPKPEHLFAAPAGGGQLPTAADLPGYSFMPSPRRWAIRT